MSGTVVALKETAFLTLCAPHWLVRRGKLADFDIERFKKTLSRQVQRHLGDALGIGYIEVEWKPLFRRYCVHVHLLVYGADKAGIRRLRSLYPSFRPKIRDKKIANHPRHPKKRGKVKGTVAEAVHDVTRLAGYICKSKTSASARYVDDEGRLRKMKPKRAPQKIHNELMCFLDKHKETDFVFLRNARISSRGKIAVLRAWLDRQANISDSDA